MYVRTCTMYVIKPRIIESNRIESNRIESNRIIESSNHRIIESNRIESNESIESNRIESNQNLDHRAMAHPFERAAPLAISYRHATHTRTHTGKEFDNILTMRSNLYSTIE